jgi:uncharacterized protein (TIGR03435 family)
VLMQCAATTESDVFEVAAVRPSDPNYRFVDFRVSPGGRLTVTRWQLSLLIERAYGVKRYQITGGPAWMDIDPYDITAKAGGNPTQPEMMAMLRALLADRFHLTLRRETWEVEGYLLLTAKGGPKLNPAKGAKGEWVRRMNRPGEWSLGGENAPTSLLAERLGEVLERPVRDKTGIEGHYDFLLKFSPPGIDLAPADAASSIFTALQEGLGLKLEKALVSMDRLTVVKAEKPAGD